MKIPIIQGNPLVILANGTFPAHQIPVSFLHSAEKIICCDGSVENLLLHGLTPDHIVGDMDSISQKTKKCFLHRIIPNFSQETNDLAKALQFCQKQKWKKITILGATGKREDHMIGNIALLHQFAKKMGIQLLTDYGVFVPQWETATFESFPKQQVSIFNLTPEIALSSTNLLYPLINRRLKYWWEGTLNESIGYQFTVEINYLAFQRQEAQLIIFREYPSEKSRKKTDFLKNTVSQNLTAPLKKFQKRIETGSRA